MKVDRTREYQVGQYSFVNFCSLDSDTIAKIREWRNSPEIREVMYNTAEISEDQHKRFVESLFKREDRYYWLVYKDNIPVGVLNVVDVDAQQGSCQLGYYLLPSQLNTGIGLEFVCKCIELIFRSLNFESIFGRTELNNRNALFVNYCLGFKVIGNMIIINDMEFVEQEVRPADFFKSGGSVMDLKVLARKRREFNEFYKVKLLGKK